MAVSRNVRAGLAAGIRPAVSHTLASQPSNSVYQGQEVKFKISPWPPSTLSTALGTTYTESWTITPDPQSPIVNSYNINSVPDGIGVDSSTGKPAAYFNWDTSQVEPGSYAIATASVTDGTNTQANVPVTPSQLTVKLRPIGSGDVLPVTMKRAAEEPTSDQALWVAIRYGANQLSFNNYLQFVDTIMCPPQTNPVTTIDSLIDQYLKDGCIGTSLRERRFLPFPNTDAYRILKIATECFVMLNCGVFLSPAGFSNLVNNNWTRPLNNQPFPLPNYDPTDDANRSTQGPSELISEWITYLKSGNQFLNPADPAQNLIIPYLALVRSRLSDLPMTSFCQMGMECAGILQRKLTNPCLIELIWSYWHEEAMLVQTMNAISRRFQNFRGSVQRDPLMRFDLDPLRRLNSLLWGYIQDEQHRLTVVRRAYEYSHEYGLSLEGKALPAMRLSDSRSKFLEAFHNLLYLATIFFKEDDDTTVVADGFPLLNSLREVHYTLAAGAANQFGELPSTARQEMLMQQWLLARPEMREFLGSKIMVPYPEEWMDRVDNVKAMEGWTDVSVIHFHDLAVFGEQIVLSARYGAWSLTTTTAAQAANWARYWRNEIQGYIHAYRAATGVDLSNEVTDVREAARRSTVPSVLLRQRMPAQAARR
jgi:hypothetical protein